MRLILLITMIIAIILSFGIGLTTLFLINKYRKKQLSNNFTNSHLNAFNSQNNGELLWELKQQTTNYLNDEEMTYTINTIIRNNYQKSCIVGFDSNYELETLIQKNNQIIDCNNFNFLLINYDKQTIVDDIKINLQKITKNGMIFVVNLPRKILINKNLWAFLKQNKIRFDYESIGKGIILIVK